MKHLKFVLVLGVFALSAIPAQAAEDCEALRQAVKADRYNLALRKELIRCYKSSQPAAPQVHAAPESQPSSATSMHSSAGLSQQQIANCTTDIHNKQRESQRWGGNANDVANRLGRYQKELFEGRCAGHPQAAAYIRGANKMLGYRNEGSTPMSGSTRQSTNSGISSGSTSSEVRDFPQPDRNRCLQVVENTRGQQCGSRSSALVRVKNVCPESIKMLLCVRDTKRNSWSCGSSTGRAGEKYLDSVLQYTCESDGRYIYAGCSEQARKGRFRNGNCGGNPNTGKHSLITY